MYMVDAVGTKKIIYVMLMYMAKLILEFLHTNT